MTLDQFQFIFLYGVFSVAVLTIVYSLTFTPNIKIVLAALLIAWFGLTYLGQIPNLGPVPGALFAIIFPVLAVSAFMFFNTSARRETAVMLVAPLVALHVTRIAGGLFIPLFWQGRLSNPFAYIAGGGDLLAAILAVPAAIIAYKGRPGWQAWVLAWNVVGFADFMSAITLGVTSQQGSPLQVFHALPGTSVLGELPWRFIPSYFVPLYLMIHIALFIRLVPQVFGQSDKTKPLHSTPL